jgi:hypothetical protein
MSVDRPHREPAWSDDAGVALERELAAARHRVQQLERELAQRTAVHWRPQGFYLAYYATSGFMLGLFAASTSLVFNVVGSLVWPYISGIPQHPLRLIQVYLTFPLGEAALSMDHGLTLALGCCLYLGTGMLYGVLFQTLLAWLTERRGFGARLLVSCGLSLVVWLVNFYGILAWLQPLLFGGRWIVELVPWWVAALTHLVFGGTMALVYPWGLYVPYRSPAEDA